jgi:predicted DsbA family dithiol-disulfide isomerase
VKRVLNIKVYFDLICPWCLIGRRHLTSAVHQLALLRPDVETVIEWRSHALLPGTPAEGIPYQSFYEQRFGSKEAVAARRAQVREAARPANIEFAFERISVLPNTLAAHRLLEYAEKQGSANRKESLIDALFTAYFLHGEDIGDRTVLARIASECGLPEDAVATCLASSEGLQRLLQKQAAPERRHVSGVPFYVFNDRLAVSGAHPPQVLLEVMQEALRVSSPAPATR